ncbi:MAG: 3-dehydroquinate synthase [Ethanoligenens sp.]
MTEIIPVQTGRPYDIHLGRGILNDIGSLAASVARTKKAVIVTDTNVGPLYGAQVRASLEAAGFEATLYAFEAGEASKNMQTLLALYSFFAQSDLTRADLVIALGGGVVGDAAGFAAATYMRGVDFIQVPTTLLAQVDSSVGGKTAVDLPEGKNLAGAFWQPRMVICDPDVLHTLDAENIACGMGEIVKHACIRSQPLYDQLVACDDLPAALPAIIAENVKIKRDVVEHDEREKGERMLLNFGHTLGHAVEKCLHYNGISHGAAVAVGMHLITRYAEKNGLTPVGTVTQIDTLLTKYHLPIDCPLPLTNVVHAAQNDKKRAGGNINLVLLHGIGDAFVHTLPIADLPAFFGV